MVLYEEVTVTKKYVKVAQDMYEDSVTMCEVCSRND